MTYYDGVNQDILPSFFRLDGTNGVRASIDNRGGGNIDYMVKMWIRS